MAHKTSRWMRGVLAVTAAVAATASLALSPVSVFAADYTTAPTTTPDVAVTTGNELGTLEVTNLQPGDTVTAYRFVESTYTAASNSLDTQLASDAYGFTISQLSQATTNSDTVNGYASDVLSHPGDTETYEAVADADGVATFSENLPFGEYLLVVTHGDIDSTVVYQHTIVNFVPTTVDDKAGYWFDGNQSIELKRQDIGESFEDDSNAGTGKKVKDNDAWAEVSDDYAAGEKAEFMISALVPNYDSAAPVANKTFRITDVLPAQLTGIEDLKVTLDTENGQDITDDLGSAITQNENGFTVDMSGDNFSLVASAQKVVITFKSTVQTGLTPNQTYANNATLTFSSNPWKTNDGGEATDDASIKTYGAFLKKLDENNQPLSGATFKLTKEGGSEIASGLVSDANGYVFVTGLDEGTYTFTETKAPDTYVLAENPSVTKTVDADSSEGSADLAGDAADFVNNGVDFGSIVNAKATMGGMLPTTGGMGTVAFTAAGVVIMAGAAAFIMRSRKSTE